jgi:F420-dependent oxidoreductase-like protein
MAFFGLYLPVFKYPGVPDDQIFARAVDIATTAEQAGFDALFPMDHFLQIPIQGPPTDPMLEAYTLLGGLAARTSRLRLGTLVTSVTYRNPALVAKMATTLDVISGGRAILGIGAGYYEPDHRAYGFDLPPVAERMDRLEEALKICRAMFGEEAPSFQGRYYRIEGALNNPRPVQPGGPPILVGGNGERRTLRLVAEYADMCNFLGVDLPAIRHKLGVLAGHCAAVGRDPGEIVKTRHSPVMLARSRAEAEGRLAGLLAGMAKARPDFDPEMARRGLIVGDVDGVVEQVGAYLDAGLDGLTVIIREAHELEPVARVGEALSRAFGRQAPVA